MKIGQIVTGVVGTRKVFKGEILAIDSEKQKFKLNGQRGYMKHG